MSVALPHTGMTKSALLLITENERQILNSDMMC